MAPAPERPQVTGIGSLPHKDPAAAVDFVFRHSPELPYLPQLVQHSPREMMIAQLADEGGERLDASNGFAALEPFRLALEASGSPIAKVQIVGPVTASAAGIGDAERRILRLAELLHQELAAPSRALIIQLDEPLLTPGQPAAAVRSLADVVAALRHRAAVWIHCCGNVDWEAITLAQPDGISFDLWSSAPPPEGFAWPAVIALGAVPTDLGRPLQECRGEAERWVARIHRGGQRDRRLHVTPACGLGMRSVPLAEEVMIRCAYTALALPAGA